MTTFYRRRKSAGLSWFEKLTKMVWIWWVWTAEPFLRNPIRMIKGWLMSGREIMEQPQQLLHDTAIRNGLERGSMLRATTQDDLDSLTPEERKALK